MNAFGVDTRSDIYSLGVLLYELLTGTTPLEKQRLRQAAFGEILRLIKEEEPPRPSVRLSRLGRPAVDRGGAEDGAGAAVEAGARRARLDRDEVPGEGPDAAVRDGQRAGQGRRAVPGRRAGGGVPAVGRLPAAEVRAQAPDADRGRRGLRCPAGGRRRRQHLAGRCGPKRAEREALASADAGAGRRAGGCRRSATEADAGRNEAEAARQSLRRSLYASDMQLAEEAWESGDILRMRELLDGQRPRAGRGRPPRLRVALPAAAGFDRPDGQAGPGRGLRAAQSRWDALRLRGEDRGAERAGCELEDRAEADGRRLGPAGAQDRPLPGRDDEQRQCSYSRSAPTASVSLFTGPRPRRVGPGGLADQGLRVGDRSRRVHARRSRRRARRRGLRPLGRAVGRGDSAGGRARRGAT